MIQDKKYIILTLIVIIAIVTFSFTSGYICINQEDNLAVQKFKTKLNLLSLKEDIDAGLTSEQIETKIKYFVPCRR